jgi:hypothetical protein
MVKIVIVADELKRGNFKGVSASLRICRKPILSGYNFSAE